jgi:hypothetical protein
MKADEEFIADFEECNAHIARGEFEEAAVIVTDYVVLLVDEDKSPPYSLLLFNTKMLLKQLPGCFAELKHFGGFIGQLVDAVNAGGVVDVRTKLN